MKWLYRIHGWVGLVSGPLLIVVCLSGALVVFKPQIDRATDTRLGRVTEAVPADEVPALDAALDALARERPEAEALAIGLPAGPDSMLTHGRRIAMQVHEDGRELGVFFDPATGRIIGYRPLSGGWGQWLRTLHIDLFAGVFGRILVGVLGVTLTLSAVTGLWIYRRFNGGRWWPRLRRGRGARIAWGEWHRLIGLATAVFALMFGVTGAVLGLKILTPLVKPPYAFLPGDPAPRSAWREAALAEAVAVAETRMPGSRVAALTLPRPDDAVLRVYFDHAAGDLVEQFISNVAIDPVSGEVVDVFDARRTSWPMRLYLAMEPIHFGRLGGAMSVMVLWSAMYVLRWVGRRRVAAGRRTPAMAPIARA